jgi:hypothetical protein
MSFTKLTLDQFSSSINKIFNETSSDNDLSEILENLNSLMEISEKFTNLDSELEFYWNEIISDIISVIYCGISGQYRLAISGLRNILELACSAFFYLDHKIELKLYVNENFKADKYVSTIIHDYNFFKTNYIRTFNPQIDSIQTKDDSVSIYLNTTYAKLCDVVHGRYKSLIKKDKLAIGYSKMHFKKFEDSYVFTLSAIAILYVLRFNDFSNEEIIKLANKSGSLKLKV